MQFKKSTALTFGLELELQIVDPATGRLSPAGMKIWDVLSSTPQTANFALEATLATIELNSGIHDGAATMHEEMMALATLARVAAQSVGCDLRGGGTQVSQFWNERRIAPSLRAQELQARFGFLTKRFSTYGMHVHVGMPDGDTAVRVGNVMQALSPLLIALAAASPFMQMSDTGFASARPLEPLVYPHGGPLPFLSNWSELQAAVQELFDTGIGHTLKDIYWDVRPKPEFGTVEMRAFDTPLAVGKAVAVAAFTRALAALALEGKLKLDAAPPASAMRVSRFMACRDGLQARLFDPFTGQWVRASDLYQSLSQMIETLGVLPQDAAQRRRLTRYLTRGEDHALMRGAWGQVAGDQDDQDTQRNALVTYSYLMCDRLLDTSMW